MSYESTYESLSDYQIERLVAFLKLGKQTPYIKEQIRLALDVVKSRKEEEE